MTSKPIFSLPSDTRGEVPAGARIWTGEVQAVAFTDTATAATQITVPGRWFYFYATNTCHITLGDAGIATPDASSKNRCFPIPDGDTAGWCGPFWVPSEFDTNQDGSGDLYIRVVRNAANGTLYIASLGPSESSTPTTVASTTSTTTTTTSTTTTSTTT